MAATMRSGSVRAPSPTYTTISGISNYRSDSYRAPRGTGMSQQEIKQTANSHYTELTGFLATHIAKEQPGARANARDKLTRLTRQQFMELSTDVFDELIRREANPTNEVPFLPGREDFHPKRNQARQKLSSLPKARFKDLASDVYFELGRRYPDFREPVIPPDTPGSVYGSEASPGIAPPVPRNPYAPNNTARRPSADDYRRPSGDDYRGRTSEDRRPSMDDAGSYHRRPSNATRPAETATAAMIVPSKSTIATEEIESPFERPISTVSSTQQNEADSPIDEDDDDIREGNISALSKGDKDDGGYYENSSYGRASPNSVMSPAVSRSNTVASTREGSETAERIKRDYEFKVAQMQNKLNGLESELADALRQRDESQLSVRQLSNELEDLRIRSSEQSKAIRDLEHDLDDARAQVSVPSVPTTTDSAGLDKLRADLEHVMDDLADLSSRNDELQAEHEADMEAMRALEVDSREWKRKYEQAKTELRSVKASSSLFLQQSKLTEDQLPVSGDGVILDIHVTSFQSALDSLLTTGRSNAPSRVLQSMKSVVDAVTAILEDVAQSPQAQDGPTQALRDRCQATLNNLLTAARTHATSYGMSPVSLLDAAASHVAHSVTELGKSLRLRRATKADVDAWERRAAAGGGAPKFNGAAATNGYTHAHTPSVQTIRETASSSGSPISVRSGVSVYKGGAGDSWGELKPYIEQQCDSILQAVSGVLANVRAPAATGVGDNVSQIIALVGSVVAVCNGPDAGALPPRAKTLARNLGDHADQLSNAAPRGGSNGELSKEARQAIAKSTFEIAGAVKELVKL
ncbi:hypothetical protein BKA62DRAFT_376181 [Auriculariales sp. MPI-PUGE-AT-0066]|nr:hypothetical protein BKA62DRAFT_376181 [Auriculariales sp. MPI-PUGE-AT-0066]